MTGDLDAHADVRRLLAHLILSTNECLQYLPVAFHQNSAIPCHANAGNTPYGVFTQLPLPLSQCMHACSRGKKRTDSNEKEVLTP